MNVRKKAGWIWIIGAILLFAANTFTLANQVVINAQWASTASILIGFVLCPALILIGIGILILGKKK